MHFANQVQNSDYQKKLNLAAFTLVRASKMIYDLGLVLIDNISDPTCYSNFTNIAKAMVLQCQKIAAISAEKPPNQGSIPPLTAELQEEYVNGYQAAMDTVLVDMKEFGQKFKSKYVCCNGLIS